MLRRVYRLFGPNSLVYVLTFTVYNELLSTVDPSETVHGVTIPLSIL